MYNAEVLSKFPVVQHFPFGSLFCWEKDPAAVPVTASVYTSSQPSMSVPPPQSRSVPLRDLMQEGTRASWSNGSGKMAPLGGTAAPWASRQPTRGPVPVPGDPNQPTRAPWAASTAVPQPSSGSATAAPWEKPERSENSSAPQTAMPPAGAPWLGASAELM